MFFDVTQLARYFGQSDCRPSLQDKSAYYALRPVFHQFRFAVEVVFLAGQEHFLTQVAASIPLPVTTAVKCDPWTLSSKAAAMWLMIELTRPCFVTSARKERNVRSIFPPKTEFNTSIFVGFNIRTLQKLKIVVAPAGGFQPISCLTLYRLHLVGFGSNVIKWFRVTTGTTIILVKIYCPSSDWKQAFFSASRRLSSVSIFFQLSLLRVEQPDCFKFSNSSCFSRFIIHHGQWSQYGLQSSNFCLFRQ